METTHRQKLRSAKEAAELIKSGDRVVLANLCAEPRLLPDSLMDRAPDIHGVRLFQMRPLGAFIQRCSEPGMEEHVKWATAFTGGVGQINRLIKDGRADFYPIPLSKIPWLFRSGTFRPDVFMGTVSPPDNQGYCSLGVSVDYAHAAMETAKTVIVEVNENMPRTGGDSLVHVSDIDYFVESDEPIYELPPAEKTGLEEKLAENVAGLVDDGATIQIGWGAVSESIPPFLKEKRNLGMHSEMFPASAVTLVEEGALTCQRMAINKGKIVCAFAAGGKETYDWLNENSMIQMKHLDYTNDSRVIAMNHKMTTINAALQVDLYGNVYADMLGFDQYSGAGGQPDFILGAQLCPEGKSIIVLPSTALNGKASRIVSHPSLTGNPKAPAIPTIARFHADYVVTELGVASLKDKTTRERAKELVKIAHPDFMDALYTDGRKLNLS
ncbi:MAG: acetyl-CoA hydrolase/transferase C-terminal domain-containing protein [Candidatus Bathyarchaeia archaeon]